MFFPSARTKGLLMRAGDIDSLVLDQGRRGGERFSAPRLDGRLDELLQKHPAVVHVPVEKYFDPIGIKNPFCLLGFLFPFFNVMKKNVEPKNCRRCHLDRKRQPYLIFRSELG